VPSCFNHIIKRHLLHGFFFAFCLFFCESVKAQSKENYQISFKDTLEAAQSFLLYNFIHLKNLSSDSASFVVKISASASWDLISPKETKIKIGGLQEIIIPLTLKKNKSTQPIWQQINFTIETPGIAYRQNYFFNIYSEPVSKLNVQNVYQGLSNKDPHNILVNFIMKNSGNIDGLYHVTIQNENLGLLYKQIIHLRPGEDSVIKYTYHLNNKIWQHFNNETVTLNIADSLFKKPVVREKERFIRSGSSNNWSNTYYDHFDLFRTDSIFSMHKTDYNDVKLGFETGFIGSSSRVNYYAALRLSYDISKYSKFSFYYRSRQFGIFNTIDQDVFTISLKTKYWDIKAGKISNSKFFLTYGNGIEVGYSWKNNNKITVFGVKHTPGFHTTNDNAGILLKYNIRNVLVNHDLLYNTDSASRIQSGILNNDIEWRTKKMEVNINAGIGTEYNTNMVKNNIKLQNGYGGYKIIYRIKEWAISSNYRKYGKSFPGLYAGSSTQNHVVAYRLKRFAAELFYQVNITRNNFFKDTLFNTDITTFNTTKYGVRLSQNTKKSFLSVGFGQLSQEGQVAYSFTPRYQYIELQYSLRGIKYLGLSFSNSSGYAAQKNYKTGPVFFTQSSLSISYKSLGINGGNTSTPVIDSIKKAVYSNTLYGGPYLSVKCGKNLNLGFQYSLSKTLYDNNVNSFAGVNLAYTNAAAGTTILANISSPLKKANEKSIDPFKNGYVNISLVKNFSLPYIFKKKYHTLETVFVVDQNSNQIADSNERRIPNVAFAVNNLHFISNSKGVAKYRHIGNADYTVDFTDSKIPGLVPKKGNVQTIKSQSNEKISILFSNVSVISGHINILQDSSSDVYFLANNIKVMAKNQVGDVQMTTTDNKGNYFFNLPAGMYHVSLNQDAFNQKYWPDKMNAEADLVKSKKVIIDFEIRQKRRQIKILNSNPGKEVITKQPEEQKADDNKPKAVKPIH